MARTRTEEAQRVQRLIADLRTAHPGARLDLDFSTPLELLIALILAAQCTDEKVNQVTASLFRRYRTAADWAAAPPARLEREVRPTGFFRSKARAIRTCCQRLVAEHGGQVPDSLEALLRLPGVGRKTANIVLGNAFGRPAIGVDTHVARLSQRLGLTRQTDPDKIEGDLIPLVREGDRVAFGHLLQYHGRRICSARAPKCPVCSVNRLCPFPRRSRIAHAGTRSRRGARA